MKHTPGSEVLENRKNKTLACPACGRPTAQLYLYSRNGCDILQCQECGLGRSETAGFNPSSYYTDDYFSGGHDDGYADYLGAERVLRREFARVVDFIRGLCPRGKLVELGCAYGFFLQEAKSFYEVSGIEIAAEAAEHARRSGLNVLDGVADENNLRKLGAMDIIVLLDVIEHVPQPRETLSLCARFLNPGGIIVLTTGDFGSPLAKLTRARWRLMTPPQHLWFFTKASLQRLASGLGLRLEAADHPWKIVPLSLILFQARRMLGLKPGREPAASQIGLPVNLFDAMRIVLRKPMQP